MNEIAQLRKRIDEIDDQILTALCERIKVARAIGDAKKKHGKPIRDASRENAIYKRLKERAVELGLDGREVEAVYREIVNMCSSVQQ